MIKDEFGNRRFYGIYRGVVVDTNDPLNKNRIKVQVPQILLSEVTGWAWGMASSGTVRVAPSIGDGVWVQFEGGDPSYPIWVGTFEPLKKVYGVPVPVTGDLIPDVDDAYSIGSAAKRWKNIFLGPGTVNVTDSVLGTNATIGVANGVFFINGIAQAQLPNLKVTNLTFNDNTTQTTAAVAQVNSDWNATSGKAQILNKPTIPSDPTPTAYSPVFSSSGGTSQIAFTGTPATGSYMKQGKLVHFRIKVLYTTMTAFGAGNGNQYFITLPFAPTEKYVFRNAAYEKFSNSGHYELSAHATAGLTTMALYHSAGGGNEVLMNHSAPTSPSTADYFYLSGTYEATT